MPGMAAVVAALGVWRRLARASTEPRVLADLTREWKEELRTRTGRGADAFARDAEVHVIQGQPAQAAPRCRAQAAAADSCSAVDIGCGGGQPD